MLAQETRPLSPSDPEWVKKFPQPKFKLGQQVQHTWTCDDELDKKLFGQTLTSYGFVFGCWFLERELRGDGLVLGWVYQVFFDYMAEQAIYDNIIPVNHFWRMSEIHEDELDEYNLNPD